MNLQFEKYQGNGNDFIIIDDRTLSFKASKKKIHQLCDRRFGIGADGLMLVRNSEKANFEMIYYNSDGAEGTMCGNGGRCIAAFAYSHKIVLEEIIFSAVDGLHEATINKAKDGLYDVSLEMQPVNKVVKYDKSYFINTGSPHHIEFVADANSTDVYNRGMEIRNSDKYTPGGTNVDFVEIKGKSLYVRTFERGVEDETLSCGTGVIASALAAFLETGNKDWRIKTRGGNFEVTFNSEGDRFSDIWLHGPAQCVFKGEIEI